MFQIHKIIGFAPSLLQVVMLSDVDMPVRQAGKLVLESTECYTYAIRVCFACRVYLCTLYNPGNEQRLFLCTALSDWSI
jgi:hypothetical protein